MTRKPKERDAGFSLPGFSVEKFATTARADLRFAPLNVFLLVALFGVGLAVHLAVHDFSITAVALALGSALVLAVCLRVTQIWEVALVLGTADCLLIYLLLRPASEVLLTTVVVALLVSGCVQIAYQWERALVLRFGRFRALKPSGVFFILPIVDKVAQFVDQRIRVSDFSAETTLTADTVPVNVDAIAFWMVWDAEKSVLEVAQFEQAVILSAQTALRNAIGKHDLAQLLSQRERLGGEIQTVLDEKTNAWGITTQAVEIRDIVIPKGLEDAMSRQAQAERERQSRIILGTAETEIAEKFATASEHYRDNPVALHLRAMNMVYEGLRQKGSMVIFPTRSAPVASRPPPRSGPRPSPPTPPDPDWPGAETEETPASARAERRTPCPPNPSRSPLSPRSCWGSSRSLTCCVRCSRCRSSSGISRSRSRSASSPPSSPALSPSVSGARRAGRWHGRGSRNPASSRVSATGRKTRRGREPPRAEVTREPDLEEPDAER